MIRRPVPGVSIKVMNAGNERHDDRHLVRTRAFNVANLPPGTYRLEASRVRVPKAIVEGIVLTAGAMMRLTCC